MHLSEAVNIGFSFLAPWLVFVPAIGLLTNMILGPWFMKHTWGEKAVGMVASLACGVDFIIAVLLAWSVSVNHGVITPWTLGPWIHIGDLQVDWTFRID